MMEDLIIIALVVGGLGLVWLACVAEDAVEDDWAKHDRSRQL